MRVQTAVLHSVALCQWDRLNASKPQFYSHSCLRFQEEILPPSSSFVSFLAASISPGEGDGNPLQYSCLDNPTDRGAWQAIVHGAAKSWTQLNEHTVYLYLGMLYRWRSRKKYAKKQNNCLLNGSGYSLVVERNAIKFPGCLSIIYFTIAVMAYLR